MGADPVTALLHFSNTPLLHYSTLSNLPARRQRSQDGFPRSGLWPVQMFVEEVERADSVNLVWPGEKFDLAHVRWELELPGVQMAYFCKLIRNGLIRSHAIKEATFNHERSRCDERCHFGIVKRAAQVKLEDFVLPHPNVTIRAAGGSVLPDPIVEVA